MILGTLLKIIIEQLFIHIETVSKSDRKVTVFSFQYLPGFCFPPASVLTNLIQAQERFVHLFSLLHIMKQAAGFMHCS